MPDSEVARIVASCPRAAGRPSSPTSIVTIALADCVQLDVRDRADGLAAHAHLVARHELAGVQEDRLDLVGVAAAEDREGRQRNGSDQRRKRENSRHG